MLKKDLEIELSQANNLVAKYREDIRAIEYDLKCSKDEKAKLQELVDDHEKRAERVETAIDAMLNLNCSEPMNFRDSLRDSVVMDKLVNGDLTAPPETELYKALVYLLGILRQSYRVNMDHFR